MVRVRRVNVWGDGVNEVELSYGVSVWVSVCVMLCSLWFLPLVECEAAARGAQSAWSDCGGHHTSVFSIPRFQNQEQLKDQDSDFLCDDSDLTLTFGDAALTANGASGGAAAASGWSANGKRMGSTSEEALERETDSREQELLSRGTRLVFPIEDHIWVAISKFPPSHCGLTRPRDDMSPWGPQRWLGTQRRGQVFWGLSLSRRTAKGALTELHFILGHTRKWLSVSFKINKWEVFPAGHWGGVLILSYVTTPQGFCNKCANWCVCLWKNDVPIQHLCKEAGMSTKKDGGLCRLSLSWMKEHGGRMWTSKGRQYSALFLFVEAALPPPQCHLDCSLDIPACFLREA